MDMLSNWWGGKPEKKISEEKIDDQNAGGGEAVPTYRKEDSAPASEDTAPRNDTPADTAGQGNSSPATATDDEQPSGDDKETADNTKVNDETEKAAKSENKETSASLGGLTTMTKDEAAEAAEAALNSAYNFGSELIH